MSSDEEDVVNLIAAFQKGPRKLSLRGRSRPSFSPGNFISSGDEDHASQSSPAQPRKAVAVVVSPVRNREEYTYYEPREAVQNILREFTHKGDLMYEVKLSDGNTREVSESAISAITSVGEIALSLM